MKQSKKDIKKEFLSERGQGGELTPIIIENGVICIPTSRGYVKAKEDKEDGRKRNKHKDSKR